MVGIKLRLLRSLAGWPGALFKAALVHSYVVVLCTVFAFESLCAVDAPIAVDSRIKTYIFNPTEVFPIVLHYGYSTHIDLRPKEVVRDIIMGDNSVWTVDVKNNRVFIRANEVDAHTNMTLITNFDVYELDLFSRSPEDGIDLDMAYVVRFFHPPTPEEMAEVLGVGEPLPAPASRVETAPTFKVGDLLSSDINYNFKSSGDLSMAPTVVLTDGKVTYMKFPNTKEGLPRIYEVSGTSEKLLDMLEYNGYIIVNSTASRFILRRNKATVNVVKQ